MILRVHVIELEHHGDNGCRVTCRRCGLLGDVGERIAGELIASHRRELTPSTLGESDG